MVSELTWKLLKRSGGAILATVTSVDKAPDKLLANAFEYEKRFRKDLDALGPFVRIDLVINSHGGYVASALGLVSVLTEVLKTRSVRILIEQAGSAASLVAFGPGVPVSITPGGSIYLHMPKTERWGRTGGSWKLLEKLQKSSAVKYMSETYANAAGVKRKQALAWMEAGTRFNASEAVAARFCVKAISRAEWEAA